MRRRKIILLFITLSSMQLLSGMWYAAENIESKETENSGTVRTLSKKSYSFTNKIGNHHVQRMQTLRKSCRLLGFVEDMNATDIRAHITPNLDVLYCRVNKCASTMTLELLKQLYDCDTECLIDIADHVRLQANAREIMNDAVSFMIVREPYGRLFSTYCNIFYFPKEDWLYRGTKIIKLTRSNISYDSMTYGHDLTFAELIKYTVDTYELGNRLDEHVRPMHHKSCNPCVFQFDCIAHLETLDTDFNFIFDKLRKKSMVEKTPQQIIASLKNWTNFGPIKHLFRTIPLLKGSNISLYNVYLRVWCYYQITGHILKTINFPYDKKDAFYIKKEDFLQQLSTAMKLSGKNKLKLKLQREEAMLQAYSTISTDYMNRLSEVVKSDCLLFDYQEKPIHLFGERRCVNGCMKFRYFKGL